MKFYFLKEYWVAHNNFSLYNSFYSSINNNFTINFMSFKINGYSHYLLLYHHKKKYTCKFQVEMFIHFFIVRILTNKL